MDPVTLIGVVSASVQIAQFIGSTIQSLNTLKGKFKEAHTTIRLLIGQLSTIKAAIIQIRDWAEYNFDDSPKERQFLLGLNVALDGCQACMDVLSEEVRDLMSGGESDGAMVWGTFARVRAVWSEESMKAHQERLSAQVQALQLLLLAGQCRDAAAQSQLLNLRENRMLIEKVAEDTKTLRESQSSVASQSIRSQTRQSSISETIFEFDGKLAETNPYRNIMARRMLEQKGEKGGNATNQKPVTLPTLGNDEGYETGTTKSGGRSPELSKSEMDYSGNKLQTLVFGYRNVQRQNSTASSSTTSQPAVHRWLSTSSLSTNTDGVKESPSGDAGKKKFWGSGFSRINTLSSSRLKSSSLKPSSGASSSASLQRPKRNRNENIHQSIDFTSTEGLETPTIIKVAQAGNRIEIETLLDNGENIEEPDTITQRTALAVAAHCGSAEMVQLLIQRRAKIDTRDANGCTPLHLAASRGHCKAMALLLNEEAAVEAADKNNQTPLWIAAANGYPKAVEMLLKRGAKVNSRGNNQLTALHMATKQGDREMIELLLRNNAHIEARDSSSMAALHHACENGHSEIAELLLQRGANIETPGKNSMSPLSCAAASGHFQVVELLIKKKASPKSVDEKKANALHWAAKNGHLEVVEYLLAWRMPIHDTDANGLTALHHAIIGSHFAVADFLLQKNASVRSTCAGGRTPLHYACSSANPDIVRLLLSAGAQPELQVSADGRRPIHIAADHGAAEIVDLLHQKGVDIAARDTAGDRPLCVACARGHVAVVEKLLDLGEPLRMQLRNRSESDSPLCIAAKAGHLDVVRLLIHRGASVKQRDEYGSIPLRYAAYYGHPNVLQLLLEEGAKLVDDGEDSNGWGLLLMPDRIGFSDSSNISDEKKARVKQLLDGAERRMNEPGVGFGKRAELEWGAGAQQPFQNYSELAGSAFTGAELAATTNPFSLRSPNSNLGLRSNPMPSILLASRSPPPLSSSPQHQATTSTSAEEQQQPSTYQSYTPAPPRPPSLFSEPSKASQQYNPSPPPSIYEIDHHPISPTTSFFDPQQQNGIPIARPEIYEDSRISRDTGPVLFRNMGEEVYGEGKAEQRIKDMQAQILRLERMLGHRGGERGERGVEEEVGWGEIHELP